MHPLDGTTSLPIMVVILWIYYATSLSRHYVTSLKIHMYTCTAFADQTLLKETDNKEIQQHRNLIWKVTNTYTNINDFDVKGSPPPHLYIKGSSRPRPNIKNCRLPLGLRIMNYRVSKLRPFDLYGSSWEVNSSLAILSYYM